MYDQYGEQINIFLILRRTISPKWKEVHTRNNDYYNLYKHVRVLLLSHFVMNFNVHQEISQ